MSVDSLCGTSNGELLEIGRITRPHGVRGEVRVQLFWSGSEALFEVPRVLVRLAEGTERWFCIAGVRRANRLVLLRLEGVDTMDAAADLKGALVLVSRAAMPPLDEDEYYLVDLKGARVSCGAEPVGVVVEVRPYATVDALVIETPAGKRFEQPVVEHWIERIDVARGLVVLASTDGLIE